jgi:adenine-specific DNA-methyltransferase
MTIQCRLLDKIMDTILVQILKDIFKKFPQFWNGESLQRALVVDAIQKKDSQVIKALISNEKVKSIYSTKIDDVLIFDFDKLISLLKYKEYWADSFTKYRNKVGLTSAGKYLDYSSDVVLDFPFKDCVLEGGMTKEDKEREEVYYNEVIARDEIDRLFSPKVLTKTKRYTKDGIQGNIAEFNDSDNLIIRWCIKKYAKKSRLNFDKIEKCK